jgi:4,5-dihydroxyphthalate decarboxylase
MTTPLTIACSDYDRTRALIDGRIRVEGYDAAFTCLPHEDMFVRAFTTADFDVSELSFSRFVLNVARGSSGYIGIPVFLSRLFRHSAIYIRTDRDIRAPSDLKGRAIGVRDYANTASLVARGMLDDEDGVSARDIRWRVGDVDHVERKQIRLPELPPGFDVEAVPADCLLSDMLAGGEIDGLIDYQPPRCFMEHHAQVGRLFPDHVSAEREYFRRTGIFPIMHVVGIKRGVAAADAKLAPALYRAFCAAKTAAVADLWSPGALKISLPWLSEEYRRTVELMGDDFWPYGIASNRPAIESILRYAHRQGLTTRQLRIEDVFSDTLLAT